MWQSCPGAKGEWVSELCGVAINIFRNHSIRICVKEDIQSD